MRMGFKLKKGLAAATPAFILFLILGFFFFNPAVQAEEEEGSETTGEISALAAVLMDRESGRILWERNPDQKLPMASTTKIMTALLALELGHETDLIVVSEKAANTEGSSIWLEEGEEITLEELLYGLMLLSGNAAAVAIAEHIAGSVEAFARLMNIKARALGAHNTHFTNPHGLPDDNHYTTARDLALITRHALMNERFRDIIATPEYTISWPGHPWDRIMVNQNRLLEEYPGADGVKTGWTRKAGRCFVGSATREGWQLLVVVLNAPQMWEDAMALLDYGFHNYQKELLAEKGQYICLAEVYKGERSVNLVAAENLYYPLAAGEKAEIVSRPVLKEQIKAPLATGEPLGSLEFYLAGNMIGSVELLSGHPVERYPVGKYLQRLLSSYWD